MGWIVYSKDGQTERCVLHKLEYNGTFMGERTVSATLSSEKKIEFNIFDYIEYRGERFELDLLPTVKKISSNNYSYDLRFVSLKYELERCMMRDIVPNDNGIVYPTPLTIEFTGTVKYLTERIQACLDVMYGKGVWSIIIAEGTESEEKSISMSNQNCWDALSLVNTEYKLNYFVKGRNVTIGGEEPVVDNVFEYGKGKGLYEIERISDSYTGVVTKLRAYGGTRNLDYSYPKLPEWKDSVLPANYALSPLRLMLPSFKTDGVTDFVLASDEAIAKYGIREGVITYDDIYPSITGMKNSSGQAIDEIKSVSAITSDTQPTFTVGLYDLGFDLSESITTDEAQLSMKSGALQGYTFNITKIDKSSDGSYILTLGRNTLEEGDTGNFTVPNKDWNMKSGDKFVLLNILMPQEYIRNAENRLLSRAKEYLAKYSSTNYSYNIGMDEIFMARNVNFYNNIMEGKRLTVNDKEIGINNENIIIQSLTINEGKGIIPTFEVTLNNEPTASTLDRIQGQISEVEASVNNKFSSDSELARQYRKKLDKSVWDSVFKIHYGEDGSVRWIETLFDLVVDGGITMYGIGDHTASTIMDGILVDGTTIGIVDGKLSVIGDIGGGTANGIRVNGSLYSPDEDGIITIPNYPTSLAWNDITGKPGWIGSTKPSYSWDEINSKPSVFPTDWENVSGKPSWIGTNKPSYDFSEISNKPTTLAGYGITDAYTKDGISELLDGYVTLDGAQDITGVKSFVNGVNIGDILVKKHSDRVVELDGDLIVTGSITIFAQGSHTASTILDALPIDETTLSKEGNKLSVIGGVGGSSVDGIILNGTTYSPDEETKLITLPNYPTTLPASDVYSWAKQPNKPSYSFGELSSHPSTLAGYGITDAYTKAESNAIYVIKSGDTMTGSLYINSGDIGTTLKLFSTAGDTYIRMINKGVDIGGFGVSAEYGVYMYNNNSASRTYVNSDGELLHNDYTVLHEGNYSGVLDNRYLYWTRISDIDANNLVKGDVPHIYEVSGGANMPSNSSWHQIMSWGTGDGNYHFQIANGYITDGLLAFRNKIAGTWGEWHTVLHNGNYAANLDSRYVLKSGDTMRGTLFLGNGIGQVGADDTYGSWLQYGVNYINVKDNGLWRNNSYKIWDEGNDGSGSGLDADTLDGFHKGDIYGYSNHHYDLNNVIPKGDGIAWNYYGYAGGESILNQPLGNNVSDSRGVMTFYNGYPLQMSWRYNDASSFWMRTRYNDVWNSWCEVAFTNGNIASATRLQTARYIYGNLFDGTSDIPSTAVGKMRYLLFTKSDGSNLGYIGRGSSSNNNIELINYESELILGANNNEDVRITTSHNVGIGTVSPGYKLHVNGDILANGYIHSVSNGISSSFGAQNAGYCHISTNAPAFWFSSELRINGSILPYDGNHWIGTADSPWGYVFSNGWFRSLGDTGWYNQTYAGGIYMTDSTYVRVYNGKRFYTSSSYYDAISTEGGFTCYANRSYPWGNGFGTINQSIPNDSGQTPLIVAYRSGSSGATNGSNRLFSVECLNSGMEVDLLFGGDIQFLFSNSGNFLANGGITMYYSSDRNLKVNIRPVTNASERLTSIGGVYDFEYIDSEVERNSIYAGTHTGLIYQNVKGGVMDCMAYEREDGKGALNYIDPSFISLLAAVEIEHEGRIQVLESENKMLKANNEKLMNRINELERRIA